jgi:hypothetical protein
MERLSGREIIMSEVEMRTVPVKYGLGGAVSLAHPLAKAGDGAQSIVVEIRNVPASISSGRVCQQYSRIMIWPRRDIVDWGEIEGKPRGAILKKKAKSETRTMQ